MNTEPTPKKRPTGSIPIAPENEDQAMPAATKAPDGTANPLPESEAPVYPRRRQRTKEPSVRWFAFIKCLLAIFVLLTGTVTACCYLLIPYLLKNVLPSTIANRIGRPVTIAEASFDPLTLTLTLQNTIIGARLADPEDKIDPIFSFSRLTMNIDSVSFIKRAFVSQALTIDNLNLHVVRDEKLSYNIVEMLHLAEPSSTLKESTAMLLPHGFSLHNISLTNGQLIFDDLPTGKTHVVKEIRLDLPVLSNLGDQEFQPDTNKQITTPQEPQETADTGQYIHPRFAAIVNGSPLSFTGETKMLGDTLEARLDLRMNELDLPYYLAYLPSESPFVVRSGKANLDLDLVFISSPGSEPSLQLMGGGELVNCQIENRLGKAVANLPTVRFNGTFNPLANRYQLQEVTFDTPEIHAGRSAGGHWTLSPSDTHKTGKTGKKSHLDSLALQVDQLLVIGGEFFFDDQYIQGGFNDSWHHVQLSVIDFSTLANKRAAFAITASNTGNSRLSGQGTISGSPFGFEGFLVFDDMDLPRYNPYLAAADSLVGAGKITKAKAHVIFNNQGQDRRYAFGFDKIDLQMENLLIRENDTDAMRVKQLNLSGGALNMGLKEATISSLTLNTADVRLTRNDSGTLNLQDAPFINLIAPDTPERWKLRVDSFFVKQGTVNYRDASTEKTTELAFTEIDLSVANLLNTPDYANEFKATALLDSVTSLRMDGQMTLSPFKVDSNVEVSNLRANTVRQFVDQRLTPETGTLQANGRFSIPDFMFKGYATLYDFSFNTNDNKTQRIYCQKAHVREAIFHLDPLSFSAAMLTLDQPALSRTFTESQETIPADFMKIPEDHLFASRFGTEDSNLKIDAIKLTGGTISITDQTVTPAYFTQISDLAVDMTTLDNRAGNRAPFTLDGKLSFMPSDKQNANITSMTAVSLKGVVGLFDETPFLDFKGNMSDFKLKLLSSYLEKHLGYEINAGRLDFQINYRLVQQTIAAEQNLTIKNLELGPGPKLGVSHTPLTVALLTEPDGAIHLDIPVTGATDDPEFSYRDTLTAAVRNLILKTAISPLSLVSSRTSGPDSLKYITFKAGEPNFEKGSEEKLAELIEILKKRPKIKLRIAGYYDDKIDQEAMLTALRKEAAHKRLKQEAELSSQLTRQYGKEEILIPDAPGQTTVLLGGTQLPREIVVKKEDLSKLAKQRISALVTYLLKNGVPQNRIATKDTGTGQSPVDSARPGPRVDIDIAAL